MSFTKEMKELQWPARAWMPAATGRDVVHLHKELGRSENGKSEYSHEGIVAYAWLRCGDHVLTGKPEREQYAELPPMMVRPHL
jgi:hypothetical protein